MARNAALQPGYSRYLLNVVPFFAADQQPFTAQHLGQMHPHIHAALQWMNGQAQRKAPNVSFALDGGIKAPVRSNRPLAWFHNANPEVLNFFRPYHQLIGQKGIEAYNTPGSRERWIMNVLADLAGLAAVSIGGRTQAVPVQGEPGKAMALLSRTIVLVNFGKTGGCDCGSAAWLGCALMARDGLMDPTTGVPPAAMASLFAHESLHTADLPDRGNTSPPPSRNAQGHDNDIMGGAMHNPIAGLGIGPGDYAILRKKANQYRSPFAVHTVPFLDMGVGMPDGDALHVAVQPGVCPPDRVRLTLSLGNGITWWKGLHLYKRDRTGQQSLVEVQDGRRTGWTEVTMQGLRISDIVLGKAKALGIHNNMYRIGDASAAMHGGKGSTFTWVRA